MIRAAVEADAAAIAALSIEVWLGTYIKNGITQAFAEFVLAEFEIERLRLAIAGRSERFWVCDARDGIVGYIRASEGRVAPVAGCGDTEISTLYVQSRHQRTGVGARLLGRVVEDCDCDLWLKVNSENTAAIVFYQAHGFERVGVTEFKIGVGAYANDVMVRRSGG